LSIQRKCSKFVVGLRVWEWGFFERVWEWG
jgi:hypothetical protein